MTFPDPPALTADGIVYDVAARVLALVVTGFTAASITLPERQYVAPGTIVAYDCAQLTVAVQRIVVGIPGARINPTRAVQCPPIRYATYQVELVRCTPVPDEAGNPPSVADLTASAKETVRDLDVLEKCLQDGAVALSGPGDLVVVGQATPVSASGGYVASLVQIDVPLSWYDDSA